MRLERGKPSAHFRAGSRASPGVAAAPFFAAATLYLLVAGGLQVARAAGAPDLAGWRWPILHLAAIGGATQLIFGAMTFFATTLLMAGTAPAWMSRAQWMLVNLSALSLVAGVLYAAPALSLIGWMALVGALGLLFAALRTLRARSLARPDPTLRYYETAIVFLAAGATLGIMMLLGIDDLLAPRVPVRLAHMHLNLVGWITLTIVGTMRLFLPTVLGTPARHLNPLWIEYWPLAAGTALIAAGWLAEATVVFVVGFVLEGLGILAYSVSVFRQGLAHRGPLTLPGAHLLAATFWLLAMTLGTLAITTIRRADPIEAAAWTAAVASVGFVGFVGQTILGAWTHLFTIVPSTFTRLSSPPAESLRPGYRAILHGQRLPQLVLTNAGVAALALGEGLSPRAPSLAAALLSIGLGSLALVLALVAVKVARVLRASLARRASSRAA